MKKLLFSLCILLFALACGKDTITLKGTIAEGETYPENTLVYLTDGNEVLASAEVKNSAFTLKAPANPKTMYFITDNPDASPTWQYSIIAEAGSFPVTFSSLYQNCAIEGSSLNEQLAEYRQSIRNIITDYRQQASALPEDAEEEFEKLYEQTLGRMKDLSLEAMDSNPHNYIALAALGNIIDDIDLDEVKDILAKCDSFITENEGIQSSVARKEAEKATSEGQPFIDFAGKTPDGKDVKLSDYVGKGRWVLTDFWASWCGPCMGEVPNIKKTHETLSGDKFTVLGIAVWERGGDNTASAKKMAEMGMTWPQIFMGSDKTATESYGIIGIPTMILFAPDGTIYKRGESLRGQKMMETVRDIINQ